MTEANRQRRIEKDLKAKRKAEFKRLNSVQHHDTRALRREQERYFNEQQAQLGWKLQQDDHLRLHGMARLEFINAGLIKPRA